jgi:GntR family transcriptional regulator, transcriptional repressor for pyruvate dehydrogenase complex
VPVREQRARNAAEAIADRLRLELITKFSDGDHLGLADDLADRFSVSGPTVRQALRVLEAEGLVRVRRGNAGGYFASTPSVRVVSRSASALLQRQGAQLADLLNSAQLIGPEVAALAAVNPDAPRRQALADYVEQAWGEDVETTVDTAIEISVELTRRLSELCGSPSLALFSAVLSDLVIDLAAQVRPIVPPELLAANTQRVRYGHGLLAQAISEGNMSAARQAQHLLNTTLTY